MQVKDFLQALTDDNKIHVEKIGSGNWYWAFISEAKKAKEGQLAKATNERDKAAAVVLEVQSKVDEAEAAREDDEDMLLEPGSDRKSLTARHAELTKQMVPLKKELAGYSESDPVEMEKKRQRASALKNEAEKWTEQIQSIEEYIKKELLGGDKGQLLLMKRDWYGDQFDEEEQDLKEL